MRGNVLHLIPSFHQGGSEKQALQLVRLLAEESSLGVRLACLDDGGTLRGDVEGLDLGPIPSFPLTSFYNRNMFFQLRRFVSHLKRERIDIVQTHDFYSNIFGMLGARLAGVPVRIAAKRETGMRSRTQLFAERRAFGLAGAIVANSKKVAGYLAAAGVAGRKLHLIYNGIDVQKYDLKIAACAENLASFGLPVGKKYRFVTIVANLRSRVKNHEMFLRAAAKIAEAHDDAGFIVAGEGELAEEMKAVAERLKISDRTFFTGRCDRVPELLGLSEICVLTSDSEGFSNSLIEYMAAANPVVATDVGGAAEAIVNGETGWVVESGDADALGRKVIELLSDKTVARSMGEKGRLRVSEMFSTATQLEKTLSLYDEELLRARPRSARSIGRARKMRIVQLGPVPPPHGGVSTNMTSIHEKLTGMGHDSRMIDVTKKSDRASSPEVLKPRSAIGLGRLLFSIDCDLVHYHIGGRFSTKLALLTLFCGLLPGKRSVVTFHSGGFAESSAGKAKPFSLRGLAFRSVDHLVGVNDRMIEMFRSYGVKPERAEIVQPFEPGRKGSPLPSDLERLAADFDPFLLSVGALEPEYLNGFLIDSMPAILRSYPKAGVMIAGAGSMEAELRHEIDSARLSDRVRLIGNVDHGVILSLIEHASVMLRITEYDGDAVSIREALTLGTPVIASDNAGRPDQVFIMDGVPSTDKLLKSLRQAEEAQFRCRPVLTEVVSNAEKVIAIYRSLLSDR